MWVSNIRYFRKIKKNINCPENPQSMNEMYKYPFSIKNEKKMFRGHKEKVWKAKNRANLLKFSCF